MIGLNHLVPTVEGRVLTVLALAEEPLSGRAIALRAGASPRQARIVLERLVQTALVERAIEPPSYLYRLNHRHVSAGAIIDLAQPRIELVRRLRSSLAGWREAPCTALLFGSVARGDQGPNSDVDILLVHVEDVDFDVWEMQVAHLHADVADWTGASAGIIYLTDGEFQHLTSDAGSFMYEAIRDGILLAGTMPVATEAAFGVPAR